MWRHRHIGSSLLLRSHSGLSWAGGWPARHPKSVLQGRIDRKMEGPGMWAQLTKMRLKTEKEQDIAGLFKQC
jgi:hypothetical protein